MASERNTGPCVSYPSILNHLGTPTTLCQVETAVIKTSLPPRPFPSHPWSLLSLPWFCPHQPRPSHWGCCYIAKNRESGRGLLRHASALTPHYSGISVPKRHICCHQYQRRLGARSSSWLVCSQHTAIRSAEYRAHASGKIHILIS